MDSQILDIIQVHVPRDDDSLSRAIGELEARLSAYSASLRTVHKRMRRAETVKATPVEPAAAPEATVAEAVAVPPPVQPADQQDRSLSPSLAEAELVKPVVEETPPLNVEAVSPSPESSEENEEALLASLDAVTAERIRVLRRLCDRKKSVRQLLSELESSPPSPPPARTRKRSWFSKG